jgi:hypothetical protein
VAASKLNNENHTQKATKIEAFCVCIAYTLHPAQRKLQLAISTELILEFVHENIHADSWRTFFEEFYLASPSINAVFKKTKPSPGERRPLSEADQVIEECAPPEEQEGASYALPATSTMQFPQMQAAI